MFAQPVLGLWPRKVSGFLAGSGCAAMIVGGVITPALADAANPAPLKTMLIASGEVTGTYYPLAGALCRVVNKEAQNVACGVIPSTGSAFNANLIASSKVDFGLMQSRSALMAQRLEGPFAAGDDQLSSLRAVLSLPGEQMVVLVREGLEIKDIADIKGKRVNLGRPGSFQRNMAELTLEAAGLSEGDLSPAVELDLSEQGKALCDGDVDVAFFAGIHPMPEVEEVMEHCSVQAVSVKGNSVGAWLKKHGWATPVTLSKDIYSAFAEDVQTYQLRTLLVTRADQSDENINQILTSVFANLTAFKGLHPILADFERSGAGTKGMGLQIHPAAAKFYQSHAVK